MTTRGHRNIRLGDTVVITADVSHGLIPLYGLRGKVLEIKKDSDGEERVTLNLVPFGKLNLLLSDVWLVRS